MDKTPKSPIEELFGKLNTTVTINNRRTILSWWLHYRLSFTFTTNSPTHIRQIIDEAEENLEDCDSKLATRFEEYIPQF